MYYVPLYIEVLRSRPVLVFWLATLAQALIWLLVPLIFYAAPPGDLPQVLAIGHEFTFRGDIGPPFAYWLAEVAFRIAGLFGVYLLSQICVVTTYWCIFTLGSAILGQAQAAMAVLLMVGISLFTVPTPDFGPSVLAMALWAVVLLQYYRIMVRGERRAWYVLGGAAALLLLTSEAALILLGVLALFTAFSARGRAALTPVEPWHVAVGLAPFLFLHLFWLAAASDGLTPALQGLLNASAGVANTTAWLRLLGVLILAHAGVAVLVVLASGWPRLHVSRAPAIIRPPLDPFALKFVKVVVLVPALLATIIAVLLGRVSPIGGAAPLLVLSSIAVIIAAGNSIELSHQSILGYAWAGLLITPAIFIPVVMILLPWTIGADLKVGQPAAEMGRFFADSFQRRTGHPLTVVSGDVRTASLIALAAPSRPSVYFDANPERSPWVTPDDIRAKGAIVVWLTADTNPDPPADIKERFPDLVPEVPRAFDRPVQGRLPLLRVGWGMIRPASAAASAQ
jgi:hypothetical protein